MQHPSSGQLDPCKVVILAGGFGTRLAEQTDDLPKPMVQIGGHPILWHILKAYSHFGYNDMLIACGYKADVIKRFFLDYRQQVADIVIDYVSDSVEYVPHTRVPWKLSLVDTGLKTMTGGRLKKLENHLKSPFVGGGKVNSGGGTFFMTYGDGVSDVDITKLLEFHKSHKCLATMTTVKSTSSFGHAQLDGDRVTTFAEKPEAPDEWINGGFFVLEPQVLDYIDGDETSFETHTLPRLARDGHLMAYKHEGFWQPMDTLRDVRNLNAMWKCGNAPWKVWDND